jgi:hypothetical protein
MTALQTPSRGDPKLFHEPVDAPPADVFPLLCPVREYEWIEPWSCDMIFSGEWPGRKPCSLPDPISPPRGVRKPGSCAGMKKIRAIAFIRLVPGFKVNRLDIVPDGGQKRHGPGLDPYLYRLE